MKRFLFKKININRWFIYFGIVITFISYKNYFLNYDKPNKLIWDETYHIASATKYLHQIMYMEPHPPLGKQLIALGEYILQPNALLDTKDFLTTNKIKKIPTTYSFLGVRLIPSLCAAGSAILFYLISIIG